MRKGFYAVWILLIAVFIIASGCSNKWVTSGKIAMNSKNFDKAIADFNKALEENPDNAEAHMFIAKCYQQKKEHDKMPPHLEAAEKLEAQKKKVEKIRAEAWLELFDAGHDKAKNEKYEEAKSDFATAILIYPSRYQAYSDYGFVWQKLDNNDSSFYYYSEAYKLEPEEKSVVENLGRVCVVTEKFDEAAALYNKLLELEPDNTEALLTLGDIEMQKGNNIEAISYYEKALDKDPDNPDVWFNIGLVYFQDLNDYEKAVNAFNRVLDLAPNDVNANINLAVSLIQLDRFDEAIAMLETFIENNPEECAGWDLYSRALLQAGKRNEALDANKKFEDCNANKE